MKLKLSSQFVWVCVLTTPVSPFVSVAAAQELPPLAAQATSASLELYAREGQQFEQVEGGSPRAPLTNLVDALELAYSTNPNLLAERARLEAINFRLPQARARSGPDIGIEARYGYRRENYEQQNGNFLAQSTWSPAASAVLSQPLFTFGRNAAGERNAAAQIDYQRAVLRVTEQQVLLQAITAYVAVRREREAVRIARENLSLLERELLDNSMRLKVRDTTKTDVQQVATRLEIGRAQLLQAQGALSSAEADFLKVVGAPAGELAAPADLALPAQNIEDAFTLAQQINPVLMAAHARERSSRAQFEGARAERRPRIDLRGRAGLETNLFGADPLRQTSLRGEVVLSGPLFQSGALGARINEAEAVNDADWRLIDDVLRETRGEVAGAWNEWLTASASVQNLRRAVYLAEQAYDGAVQQKRVGMRTTLDVLDLARDLLAARVSFNQAGAAAFLAKARLLSVVGVLDIRHLLSDRPSYDVEKSYNKTKDYSDLPLVTPLLQRLDSLMLQPSADRQSRDPSAGLLVQPVPISPASEPNPSNLEMDFDAYLQQETSTIMK